MAGKATFGFDMRPRADHCQVHRPYTSLRTTEGKSHTTYAILPCNNGRHRRRDVDHTRVFIGLVVEPQGKDLVIEFRTHGFNRSQILPWDSDIDVQMSNTTVDFLARYYNMTIHTYKKRDFMLEVNPKYTDPSYNDYLNVIDARWIDYQTGLFIDITAVRPHLWKPRVLCSKDQHEEAVSHDSGQTKRFIRSPDMLSGTRPVSFT